MNPIAIGSPSATLALLLRYLCTILALPLPSLYKDPTRTNILPIRTDRNPVSPDCVAGCVWGSMFIVPHIMRVQVAPFVYCPV